MAARHDIRRRLALALTVVVAICVAVAGCGGGDDASTAADQPEPRTPPAFAEYVAALLAEADEPGDCKRVEQIDRRSSADLACPAPEALRDRMEDFALIDTEVYNSDRSAIVNYDWGDPAATSWMVLLRDYEGRWMVQDVDFNPDEPSGNAPGEGGPDLRQTIRPYEAAVRARDCETLIRLTYRPEGAPRPSCRDQLAATARLAKVLKGDPGQRPSFNGGNRDFGFYSMTAYFPGPTHHTFTVVRAKAGGEDRFFVSAVVRDEG